jgi:hypothetical protein
MERRLNRIVLVILISFSIPLLSAYLAYYDLTEAYLLSNDICLENSDEENLLMDQHDESKLFISSPSSVRFPPGITFLEQFPRFPFITFSLDQKTFILRC